MPNSAQEIKKPLRNGLGDVTAQGRPSPQGAGGIPAKGTNGNSPNEAGGILAKGIGRIPAEEPQLGCQPPGGRERIR
jgi:hypothetical protein